jgi:hypothetical protein
MYLSHTLTHSLPHSLTHSPTHHRRNDISRDEFLTVTKKYEVTIVHLFSTSQLFLKFTSFFLFFFLSLSQVIRIEITGQNVDQVTTSFLCSMHVYLLFIKWNLATFLLICYTVCTEMLTMFLMRLLFSILIRLLIRLKEYIAKRLKKQLLLTSKDCTPNLPRNKKRWKSSNMFFPFSTHIMRIWVHTTQSDDKEFFLPILLMIRYVQGIQAGLGAGGGGCIVN